MKRIAYSNVSETVNCASVAVFDMFVVFRLISMTKTVDMAGV